VTSCRDGLALTTAERAGAPYQRLGLSGRAITSAVDALERDEFLLRDRGRGRADGGAGVTAHQSCTVPSLRRFTGR
jgi:hypothetical protein